MEPNQPEPNKQNTKANNDPVMPQTVTPASDKTSGLAIAAIILTFLFAPLGIILGIVALSSIKKSGEKGKGLAKAAIILSAIFIVLQIAAVGLIVASVQKAAKNNGINYSDGTFSANSKDGESISVGNNVKLPNGFPSDVPIYKPSEIKAAVTSAKDSYAVTLITSDNGSTVNEFYNKKLAEQGWVGSEDNSQLDFGTGKIASYTKDTRNLGVLIASDDKSSNKQTSITLTISPSSTTASE